MKTIKDYHDLYLKCNVLLLADVFEKIRSNSWKNYGLCPNHFLRALALSWDAVLNMPKGELELFPLTDMYLLFEKGMRDEVFIYLLDIVKRTISIWNLMTHNKIFKTFSRGKRPVWVSINRNDIKALNYISTWKHLKITFSKLMKDLAYSTN